MGKSKKMVLILLDKMFGKERKIKMTNRTELNVENMEQVVGGINMDAAIKHLVSHAHHSSKEE